MAANDMATLPVHGVPVEPLPRRDDHDVNIPHGVPPGGVGHVEVYVHQNLVVGSGISGMLDKKWRPVDSECECVGWE